MTTQIFSIDWNEGVTLGVALLGAALGILNTWQSINANRVKLKIAPAYLIGAYGPPMFAIEVVNLSAFAVTIREIGFTLDSRWIGGQRIAMPNPRGVDGGTLPRRLEPRETFQGYFAVSDLESSGRRIGKAYASTACGEMRYGTSPAAKQLSQLLRKRH